MKIPNRGVLSGSNIYFHTRSETARALFLYPLCTGQYECDARYAVDRLSYNSFLLLYVIKGNGYAACGETGELSLPQGSLLLLDCYAPHRYGTREGWEILWVHFDGSMARAYFEAISHGRPLVELLPPDPYAVRTDLERIYDMYHRQYQANEALINKYLTDLMTVFLLHGAPAPTRTSVISEALLTYMTENLQLPLTLEDLARRASLSPYYFTRQFKKETGYTPHEYLIAARINAARFYLKTTDMPIKEIAYKCGFSGVAGFCTTFKRLQGVTATDYRDSGE